MKLRAPRGFTLLEMLIAMAATALIAVMAHGFLSSSIAATQSSIEVMREVNDLEALWAQLEADLQYLSVRRDNVMALGAGDDLEGEDMRGSARLPAFVGGRSQANGYADPGGEQLLQLLQQGWMNPMGLRRSDLQRVAYVVEEGQLLRVSWAERNQPVLGEALTERVLLENVVNPRVRFLPADASNLEDGWADVWPLPAAASAAEAQQDDSLPLALELSFDREGMGNVRRTFVLPFL